VRAARATLVHRLSVYPCPYESEWLARYVRAILATNAEWVNDYNPLGGEALFTLAHQAAYYGAPR
jgi:hypothetical protein